MTIFTVAPANLILDPPPDWAPDMPTLAIWGLDVMGALNLLKNENQALYDAAIADGTPHAIICDFLEQRSAQIIEGMIDFIDGKNVMISGSEFYFPPISAWETNNNVGLFEAWYGIWWGVSPQGTLYLTNNPNYVSDYLTLDESAPWQPPSVTIDYSSMSVPYLDIGPKSDGNFFGGASLRDMAVIGKYLLVTSIDFVASMVYVLPLCGYPAPGNLTTGFVPDEPRSRDAVEDRAYPLPSQTPVWFANHARLLPPTIVRKK